MRFAQCAKQSSAVGATSEVCYWRAQPKGEQRPLGLLSKPRRLQKRRFCTGRLTLRKKRFVQAGLFLAEGQPASGSLLRKQGHLPYPLLARSALLLLFLRSRESEQKPPRRTWPISFADRALTCALRKCAKQSSAVGATSEVCYWRAPPKAEQRPVQTSWPKASAARPRAL